VTDLGKGDFTIRDGGKPQEVTSCEYIRLGNPTTPGSASASTKGSAAIPNLPAHELTRDQVQRSMVFLADDISFAPETIRDVREALKGVIERNLQSEDVAAIMRTSSGNSSLEQFTSDKRVLVESVGKIRWRPESRGTGSLPQTAGHMSGGWIDPLSPKRSAMVLQYVISALSELPGRKAIFFISQSLPTSPFFSNPRTGLAVLLGALVDQALRARVVIYCVDPTPLSSLAPDASYDAMSGGTPGSTPRFPGSVSAAQVSAQARRYTQQGLAWLEINRTGLRLLAEGTGGQIAEDTDIRNALTRFTGDLQGYYVLTYRPGVAEKYFDWKRGQPPPFRNVKVNVTGAGLHVRSYAGYIARSDDSVRTTPDHVRTLGAGHVGLGRAVSAALFSPFAATGVHVELYPAFTLPGPMAPELRMLVHINAHDVTFTSGDDGRHNAEFELVAGAGGDRDEPGEVVSKEVVLHLKDDSYAEAMRVGLTYPVTIAAQHPGLYDVRVAVRDSASSKLGSARGFVEVPDLLNGRLAVSGVLLHNGPDELHQFQRADSLTYMCRAFHAKSVKGEVRIVREGEQVMALPAMVVADDDGSVTLQGVLPLAALVPGLYSLQVVVNEDGSTDTGSSQWTDFEIMNY